VAARRTPRAARAKAPFSRVEALRHAPRERGGAMLTADLAEPVTARAVRSDLRPQVAGAFPRGAGVHEDGSVETVLEAAARDEPRHRQPEPVLEDARRVAGLAAGHAPADIGVGRGVGRAA